MVRVRRELLPLGWIGVLAIASLLTIAACGQIYDSRVPASTPTANGPQNAFPEAPAAELLAQGIRLSAPSANDQATISQAQAETTARGFAGPKITIRRSVLARLNYNPNSKFNCLCWAVSIIPLGGIAVPHRPAPLPSSTLRPIPSYTSKYYIVFVNANTGELEFSIQKGQQL
jgi:hypothetical protein